MSEYANNLRAIVGIDKIAAKIKDLENKAAIDSQRGVSYQDSNGTVQNLSGDAVTGTLAPNTALGSIGSTVAAAATDAAAEATKDTATTSGGGGGSTGATAGNIAGDIAGSFGAALVGVNDGVFDIADLLDDSGSGGPAIGTNEIIKSVTNAFTSTLQPLSLREDGLVIPGEGLFSVDSDDFELPDWEYGYEYRKYNLDGTYSLTSSRRDSVSSDFARRFTQGSGFDAGDRYAFISYNGKSAGGYGLLYTIAQTVSAGEPIPKSEWIETLAEATGNGPCTPGSSDSCPTTKPVHTGWLDGPGVKLYKGSNGTLAPSPRDIISSQTYGGLYNNEYGSSTILGVFFKGTGQAYFKRTPTKDGGFMYGEVTGLYGIDQKYKEDSYVHIFDSQGRQKLTVKGAEAKIYVDVGLTNI